MASSFWVTPLLGLMEFKLFSYCICTLAICRDLCWEPHPWWLWQHCALFLYTVTLLVRLPCLQQNAPSSLFQLLAWFTGGWPTLLGQCSILWCDFKLKKTQFLDEWKWMLDTGSRRGWCLDSALQGSIPIPGRPQTSLKLWKSHHFSVAQWNGKGMP